MEFDGSEFETRSVDPCVKVLLSLGSHLDPMKPMESCHGTGVLHTGLVPFTPEFIRAPAHVPMC